MKNKDTTKKKKVAIFCPYPVAGAPSQRFRYEQYLGLMQQHAISYQIHAFTDARTYAILYKKGHITRKTLGVLRGYLRRFAHLYQARHADFVLVHREASPLGPPIFEWLLAKVLRKRIIYDFDDAIWLPDAGGINRWVTRLKWHRKVGSICRWSYKVSCGNAYLCHYATKFNQSVVLNPTTIDTENLHNQVQQQHTEMPVIGWTGSHSTMRFLDELLPVLQRLAQTYTFKTLVIADRPPAFQLPGLQFVHWQAATELQDLLRMHIGVMPLTNDPWAQGKCGFKALQYLALGIPAVVSPVGVNSEIVEPEKNGYLCSEPEEWYQALAALLSDTEKRIRMGRQGRQKIEAQFSVKANQKNFLQLFS